MAYSETMLTYSVNQWSGHGDLSVKNSEYETGKSEYFLKIRAHCNDGTDTFIVKIESDRGYLPCYIIGGSAYTTSPYGCPFSLAVLSSGAYCYINFKTGSLPNNQYFHASLYSHEGSTYGIAIGSSGGITIDNVGGAGYSHTIEVEADFPLFMGTPSVYQTDENKTIKVFQVDSNFNTYINEIGNLNDLTNIDKAINYLDVVDTIPPNKVWSIHNYLKINGVLTTTKNYDFRLQHDAKIYFVLTNQIEGDGSANMILHITESPWLQKASNAPETAYMETSTLDSTYWWGNWQDYNTGVSYIGYGSTNIPIFDSEAKGTAYANGEIGIEDSINGGDSSIQTSSIGEYLESTDIPSVNVAASGVGCFAYALTEAQLKEIMETYLFTNDTTLQDTMKEALWQWGNNPIDFMIDCYYVPFDISSFYDTINTNLKFGTYQFPDTSYHAIVESNGDRIVLFDTTFEGIYGDWRDYTQFSYDLFLPFIGFVPLDVQKYLNHKVRCEMMFDFTTHNIRYYLFVDGLITDRFDGSVGINIPLMASDVVNKAKHNRDLKFGIAGDILGAVGGLAGTGKEGDVDITSSVSSIIGAVKKVGDLKAKPSSKVEGAFSSSMNVYDVSYAYLRITEDQTIIPTAVNSIYGYPSYYMGTIGTLSGYCEIDDIQLKSNCSESEYNEIINLLKEGVVL